MRRLLCAVLVALTVSLAGCAVGERAITGDQSSTPAASTAATVPPRGRADEPFDPCAEVPARVLEANGFDASSASAGLLGEDEDMPACEWRSQLNNRWHNETYLVSVVRYEFAAERVRERADFSGLEDVVVNGRDGVVFGFDGQEDTSCYVAFGTRTGRTAMVAVNMGGAAQVRPRVLGEPGCTELLLRHARWLEPYLPR